MLLSIYSPDPEGKLLVEWLKEDWAIFDLPQMEKAHAKDLLSEILDDGDIVRKPFSPLRSCHTNSLEEWDGLREELKHRNRFFPEMGLDLERLRELFPHLIFDELTSDKLFYRARIQSARPYEKSEMGAPPEISSTHGRANPAGIPYLYLASTVLTAISEIRPHTGEKISVGEFLIPEGLKLVDLREPKKTVSPFILDDESDVATLRGDVMFLERLGEELTRPVLPKAAAIDYIPSQFLCEFAKKCGFDGVVYRSSVSDGMNIALFNPMMTSCRQVCEYNVSKVSVEAEPQ
ncbi:RES family NAD+ phosphorylase [Marinobacter sp. M3C]|uniref:RES family NAD+ phosphorylase n=1 Tax=unclassified Marinobacter TaxID=83889 RepID=UPI002010B623|nr:MULTISPECIES: RES family NAD+ phosphorylase [unclassified Marinobacter]UQG54041.1 RES family NAD+ phosphorylase [Marinobacter sp. M4C]UQG60551.1 RES family NAD+ phosphorylase [Marinobacter sp. M3C]UQG62848.1 RES family NAD+ phosphorylase [Marinobacter sp. M2C]UQG71239.1 RES family NAD+ phosphorylase [Marinobacter sp. M1C]